MNLKKIVYIDLILIKNFKKNSVKMDINIILKKDGLKDINGPEIWMLGLFQLLAIKKNYTY